MGRNRPGHSRYVQGNIATPASNNKNDSFDEKNEGNNSRRTILTCWNCGKTGHLKNRCPRPEAVKNNSDFGRNQGNEQ